MIRRFRNLFNLPIEYHFWGSLVIVVFVLIVINTQINDRFGFANSELLNDVIQRWGAPITQPVPSVRYVASGAVFNTLKSLPFSQQQITIDTSMNYRKRGLIYFSGFDFEFSGTFSIVNPEDHNIDVVFVFPVSLAKNKVLLSDLTFSMNEVQQVINLPKDADKFVWTGRLAAKEKAVFLVHFVGRGLDKFRYLLDPSLPVNNFDMTFNISGGDNFDYPDYVIPANTVIKTKDKITLNWHYSSLESGVPIGIILPSEKSFDQIITTMLRRTWVPFILFFIGLVTLSRFVNYKLKIYESYLIASCYGFFFVLLPYLAAFTNFYLAYVVSITVMVGVLWVYIWHVLHNSSALFILSLLASFLVIPTLAVILEGYTGLIYTIAILTGLIAVMFLTRQSRFQNLFEEMDPTEVTHANK